MEDNRTFNRGYIKAAHAIDFSLCFVVDKPYLFQTIHQHSRFVLWSQPHCRSIHLPMVKAWPKEAFVVGEDETFCRICEVNLSSRRGLIEHMNRKHPEVNRIKHSRGRPPLSRYQKETPMPSKKMSHLDERAKITIRSVTTTMSFRPSGAPASPSEASANESEAKESENEEWVTESEVFVSGSEAGESMIASASLATVLNSL